MQDFANVTPGPLTSRSRSTRNDHHRQLPHILHLPPATRRPHKQLVLRRTRQRAPGSNTRPRRPGREPSPRRKSGARCSIMTPDPLYPTSLLPHIPALASEPGRSGNLIRDGRRNRLHRLTYYSLVISIIHHTFFFVIPKAKTSNRAGLIFASFEASSNRSIPQLSRCIKEKGS